MAIIDLLLPLVALVRQTLSAEVRAAAAAPTMPASTPAPAATPEAVAAPPAIAGHAADGGTPFAPRPIAALEMGSASAPVAEAAPERPVAPARTHDGAAAARELATRIDRLVEAARNAIHGTPLSSADFDDGLFAVLAWADETLISSPWSGARHWQRHLLQHRYFSTTTAGVAFFTRLASLREDQTQVREVYALCLSLGFKGRYVYARSAREFDEIRRATLERMLDDAGVPAGHGALLFPGAYGNASAADAADAPVPLAARRPRVRLRRRTMVSLGVPVLVLLFLYGTYRLIISQMVDAILPLIK